MSVIRHILPLSKNVCCFCDICISGHLKQLQCLECKCFAVIVFLGSLAVRREGGGAGRMCTRRVSLHVIAREMEVYPYLHASKNPYPQNLS